MPRELCHACSDFFKNVYHNIALDVVLVLYDSNIYSVAGRAAG